LTYRFSITIPKWKARDSGTSGSAVFISVCPTSLTPCTFNSWEKWFLHLAKILWEVSNQITPLILYSISSRMASLLNPLSPELNPICYLLALLAHDFFHVSRIRVKLLTLRLLMSYIHGAAILDVSRSHTTTQHSW
jgi:hypothetical protein